MYIMLIAPSICGCICYLAHIVLKWHTINVICKCPKLSDKKVENIAKMIKSFGFRRITT